MLVPMIFNPANSISKKARLCDLSSYDACLGDMSYVMSVFEREDGIEEVKS
jgi:hypothetical protein